MKVVLGQRVKAKSGGWRKALIGAAVLLVLFVAAGLIYTYLTPEFKEKSSAGTQTASGSLPEPAKQDPNARSSVSVQTISSPVAPGENVMLSVRTIQASSCKLDVKYNNVPVVDSGIVEKRADPYGAVSWTWTVGTSTPEGTWPIYITCTNVNNGMSAVGKADLVISKAAAVPGPDLGTP